MNMCFTMAVPIPHYLLKKNEIQTTVREPDTIKDLILEENKKKEIQVKGKTSREENKLGEYQ